ncbi:NAD-dependent epimerase/dehydratase family protein [Aeromonas simiae]|uniref:NAD-dependent epimerase/dehydratase family protein n=1 Tax=Aeromonas simiae TaxID=218936 RepID=UPI000A060803|nr:NAD-dependent epimerase/dehydratase family protein [Aeromonas simiae]
MNILLTGATGFIGRSVLQRLVLQTDIDVHTYGRRAPMGCVLNHINGELGESDKLHTALIGIDVVIHCAALAHMVGSYDDINKINVVATLDLARQAVAAGTKRFIFISSIGVNGSCSHDRAFRYDDVAAPWGEYSKSKYLAEKALLHLSAETGLEVVIIRPPLVYGHNAPGNFGKLLMAIDKGAILPLGRVNNKRSFVAIDNLVDLIFTCISHPTAANKVFLVSDDHDISTTELLILMAQAAGRPSRLLPVPLSVLRFVGRVTGKRAVIDRICNNLQLDISYTKKMLNWRPPISLKEGIKRCFHEGK